MKAVKTMTKAATTLAATTGVAVAVTLAATGGAVAQEGKKALEGTWQVQVQPDGAPSGFSSTLSYLPGGVVVETTSKAPMSAGIGTWDRVRPGQYSIHFSKYRFTPQGAYAGTAVIDEVTTLGEDGSYAGRAMTTLLDPSGAVVSQFSSTSTGTRQGTG